MVDGNYERGSTIELLASKTLAGGIDTIAAALASALEEAVEWNWMEEGIPDHVRHAVAAALEAYNRHQAEK